MPSVLTAQRPYIHNSIKGVKAIINRLHIRILIAIQCCCLLAAVVSYAGEQISGEALFKEKCSSCHPNATRISRNKNILKTIRNPPPYMPVFDEDRIPDKDAKKIAEYVLKILK